LHDPDAVFVLLNGCAVAGLDASVASHSAA
jgi:hypothetical protein